MQNLKSDDAAVAFIGDIDPRTECSTVREFVRCPQPTVSGTSERSEDRPSPSAGSSTITEPQEFQTPETALIRLPPRSLPLANVQVLQRWEGIVTEVEGDSFWAELKDLSEPDYPLELVELPVSQIHSDDRRLIQSGACFYWSIGIKTSDRGVITRVSEIRFQRLPVWTRRSIAAAKKEAEKAFGSFWLAEPCSAE